MRKIKFRGIRVDNGKMIYGDLSARFGDIYIYPIGSRSAYKVKPETLGQYTGLTDKDGTEIYEGDMYVSVASQLLGARQDAKPTHTVYWNEYRAAFWETFILNGGSQLYSPLPSKDGMREYNIKVVGNIHDNPELIKEKEK